MKVFQFNPGTRAFVFTLTALVYLFVFAPVLFVITARPALLDQHPEWLDLGGNAIRFDLAPLDADHAEAMVEHLLAPTGEPPEELIDETVELASGNPYLIGTLERYWTHSLRIWYLVLDRVPGLGHAVHDQTQLVQALLDGDAQSARTIMREHILAFQADVLAAFSQEDATAPSP